MAVSKLKIRSFTLVLCVADQLINKRSQMKKCWLGKLTIKTALSVTKSRLTYVNKTQLLFDVSIQGRVFNAILDSRGPLASIYIPWPYKVVCGRSQWFSTRNFTSSEFFMPWTRHQTLCDLHGYMMVDWHTELEYCWVTMKALSYLLVIVYGHLCPIVAH